MSKTYTVTEEFLQEAHKEACAEWKQKLETEFPEAFKKVEIGKWYKEEGSNLLFCVEEITSRVIIGYGFDRWYGKWFSNYAWENIPLRECIKLATKKEVQNALLNEAEKRYGKNWKKIKVEPIKEKCPSNNTGVYSTRFFFECNELWNKNGILFKDGVWAEVIEDKCSEKEELLQQLRQLQEKIEKLC